MKSVLITGASSGIGSSLVAAYADMGYRTYACGRNKQKLAAIATDNSCVEPLAFDLNDKASVQAATADLQRLDLVILNAGDCEYIDNPLEFDADLFERIIRINLISVGYALEALLPKIQPGGRLVLVSSSVVHLPLPRAEAYGASKAGLSYLAKTLSLDLAPHNIQVSLVHPGFVKTPLTDKNTFAMPCLMEADQAARRIVTGIAKGKFLIQFPNRFIYGMKLLSVLPHWLWRRIVAPKQAAGAAPHKPA